MRVRGWINHAFDRQYFGSQPDGFSKITGDARHGGEKQVSKAVTVKLTPAIETKLEKLRHQVFVFRESDHAVADIARR